MLVPEDRMTRIARTAACLAFAWLAAFGVHARTANADDAAARALVAKGALLVDVRTPAEYAVGHLQGARNIPVGELGNRANELGPKTRAIVVYCASGRRSAAAKRLLVTEGFNAVHDLGSINNW